MNLPSLFRENFGPFRRIYSLERDMERLLDAFQEDFAFPSAFTSPELATRGAYLPSCDVEETESHYVMSMDLPGMTRDEIRIELKNGVLSVSGERKEEHEEKKKGRFRSERYFGTFRRSFSVPSELKPEQVAVDYTNGVLRIAIPKLGAAKGQQIKIGESRPEAFDRLVKHEKKTIEVKGEGKAA